MHAIHIGAVLLLALHTAATTSPSVRAVCAPVIVPDAKAEREVAQLSDADLDEICSRVLCRSSFQQIIPPYMGTTSWIWRQWRGTILRAMWFPVLKNVGVSAACLMLANALGWNLEDRLQIFEKLWQYHLTFSTFVVTFFLSQAYSFWETSYDLTRSVQGGVNDISLLLATHAVRRGRNRQLTPEATRMLSETSRQLCLVHTLFWAGIVCSAPSDEFQDRSYRNLLSQRGLRALCARRLLHEKELESLTLTRLPVNRYSYIVLEWLASRVAAQGAAAGGGCLHGGPMIQQLLFQKFCALRGAMMTIPDELDKRMPKAFVHFAHLLVDTLVIGAPFALYPRMGYFALMAAGLITLFFQGLLELSKSFLDPFGSRRASSKSFYMDIQIGVLLSEINAGTEAWLAGAHNLPSLEL